MERKRFFKLVKDVFQCNSNFESDIVSTLILENRVLEHENKASGKSLFVGKNGIGDRFARGKFIFTVFYSTGQTKSYPAGAEVKHDCLVPRALTNTSKSKKILYIQLHGINLLETVSRVIPKHIKVAYNERQRCTLCGTTSDIVPDHKDGLYTTRAKTLDDFQPLCIHCNFVKRERYKKYVTSKDKADISIGTIPFLTPLLNLLEESGSDICFWEDPTLCISRLCVKLKLKFELPQ